MVRPLATLVVGRVNARTIEQIVHQVLVEAAAAALERRGDASNTRAVSLYTGLPPDSVEQARAFPDSAEMPDFLAESAIMETWRSDPDFFDSDGNLLDLPITGPGITFAALVERSCGQWASVANTLDALVDSGNIEIVDDTVVRVLHPYYRALRRDEKAVLQSGFLAISRLASVIAHNLNGDGNRLLQQDRWSRRVPESDVPEVLSQCREATQRHIKEIEQLIERYETSAIQEPSVRLGVGWYHWAESPDFDYL